jgi:hypothetical protein
VDFPGTAVLGEEVVFAVSSHDPAGVNDPLNYRWDYGDLQPPVSGADLTSSSHVFAAAGTFEVSLTVADDDGGTTTVARSIVITIPEPGPPRVVASEQNDGGGFSSLDSLTLTFDQDVAASLDTADLTLLNPATGQPVDMSGAVLAWDEATNTARWDLSNVEAAAGSYLVYLDGEGVRNGFGKSLDGDGDGLAGGDFQRSLVITLAGDADLDLGVGFSDFTLLADHFGMAGGWARGDFDGDGRVGFSDFVLLAGNFGGTVAP